VEVIPSNLCTLVEQLEDARQFHEGAALRSAGFQRECHSERSRAYATMLSEIRDWESRKRRPSNGPDFHAAVDAPGDILTDDSYAALLERVYRIHSSVASHRRAIGLTAGAVAMGNMAAHGRPREGEPMHC
jgi:hypothetical protein